LQGEIKDVTGGKAKPSSSAPNSRKKDHYLEEVKDGAAASPRLARRRQSIRLVRSFSADMDPVRRLEFPAKEKKKGKGG